MGVLLGKLFKNHDIFFHCQLICYVKIHLKSRKLEQAPKINQKSVKKKFIKIETLSDIVYILFGCKLLYILPIEQLHIINKMIMKKQTGRQKSPKENKQKQKHDKNQTMDPTRLDFSFKNIRHLNELPQNLPTQNSKKKSLQQTQFEQTGPIAQPSQQNNLVGIKNATNTNLSINMNEGQKQVQQVVEPKLQIIRTIETSDHNYLQNQKKKVINKKQKVQKKTHKIQTQPMSALFLRYNKLVSIQNFIQLVEPVFPNMITNLLWIDLSHNRLTQLSPDLGLLKNLKTLYIHGNYIANFAELDKVKNAKQLITITVYANPLQQYEQFRIIVHSILPTLKKIDSTLLTKRQAERAAVLMKSLKKYPVIKNKKKLPQQSQNSQEDG